MGTKRLFTQEQRKFIADHWPAQSAVWIAEQIGAPTRQVKNYIWRWLGTKKDLLKAQAIRAERSKKQKPEPEPYLAPLKRDQWCDAGDLEWMRQWRRHADERRAMQEARRHVWLRYRNPPESVRS